MRTSWRLLLRVAMLPVALGLMLAAGCDRPESGAAPADNKAATGGDAGAGKIVVGHFGSMTGSEATFGKSTDNGIKLAFEEINGAGGVKGRQLELITYDTKGQTAEAGNAVTRLITQDKVTALLGEVASSLSLAGGQVAEEKGVPMISPSSTNPKVTQDKKMVFRVCFIDPFQGYVMATFAKENLKVSKVAVLYDQGQAYSTGLKSDFIKAFTGIGGTITTEQAYSGGDQDFSAQLSTIRDSGAEAVFVPGYYNDVGNIAVQARNVGVKVPLLGGDGWESDKLIEIGGAALEGCYYSTHYTPEDPRVELQSFIKKYKDTYGSAPDSMAALGYDAAKLLADAMGRAANLEGETLANAIGATKGFAGVTGTITINKEHNAEKPAVVLGIQGGKTTYVTSIAPK